MPDNTALNRTIVLLMQNKSSAAVAQGDVVIWDPTVATAFDTTTSGSYTDDSLGVVMDPNGIALDARGLVAVAGYVPKILLTGTAAVRDLFRTATGTAKRAVSHAPPRGVGDFGQVLTSGSAPEALLWGFPVTGTGGGAGGPDLASVPETHEGVISTKATTPAGMLHRWVPATSGSALIGKDFTGNTRGLNAVDIQTTRSAGVTRVASGARAVAVGSNIIAAGVYSVGLGATVEVSGPRSVASGYTAAVTALAGYAVAIGAGAVVNAIEGTVLGSYASVSSTGSQGVAVGNFASVSAQNAIAIGKSAKGRIKQAANIAAMIINRKDDGEAAANALQNYCGVNVVLMSKEIDLKVVADTTLTLPVGCKFWWDEMGIIATVVTTLTTQPTVRFGITGTPAKHLAAVTTTLLTAAAKRQKYTPLVPEDGETSLLGGVTVAAVATTMLGRYYFRGILVEDE